MARTDLLIVGATGFIGHALLPALAAEHRVTAVRFASPAAFSDVRWVRIGTDPVDAERVLRELRPGVIVNTAALAAPSACQADPELARRLNVDLPAVLAESDARLIHLSTDQVFDGTRGRYSENDGPGPISVYGSTKLEGENAVRDRSDNSVLLRVNLVCGRSAGARMSSVDGMLAAAARGEKIRLFADEYRSPVAISDVVIAVKRLIESAFTGLLHLGGPRLSRLQLGLPILEKHGYGSLVRATSIEDYEGPPRARDTSFDSTRSERELGIVSRDLEGIVAGC